MTFRIGWSALALSALLALESCTSTWTVTVEASREDMQTVQAVYLLVGPEDKVAIDDARAATDPENATKFLCYEIFRPEMGASDGPVFAQVPPITEHAHIEFEIDQDGKGSTIEMSISEDLFEDAPAAAASVIVQFNTQNPSERWQAKPFKTADVKTFKSKDLRIVNLRLVPQS